MADTKEIINCPACGKEMEKVFINGANVNIDICTDGCGGILFDNRELEKFDENHENADEILNKVAGKNFAPVDKNKYRICPVCGSIMTKMGAALGEVQIDLCNMCGAKFLDHGELEKIREVSGKQYEESSQNKIIGENLEKESEREAIGLVGMFVRDHIKVSDGRQAVENFVKRYI